MFRTWCSNNSSQSESPGQRESSSLPWLALPSSEKEFWENFRKVSSDAWYLSYSMFNQSVTSPGKMEFYWFFRISSRRPTRDVDWLSISDFFYNLDQWGKVFLKRIETKGWVKAWGCNKILLFHVELILWAPLPSRIRSSLELRFWTVQWRSFPFSRPTYHPPSCGRNSHCNMNNSDSATVSSPKRSLRLPSASGYPSSECSRLPSVGWIPSPCRRRSACCLPQKGVIERGVSHRTVPRTKGWVGKDRSNKAQDIPRLRHVYGQGLETTRQLLPPFVPGHGQEGHRPRRGKRRKWTPLLSSPLRLLLLSPVCRVFASSILPSALLHALLFSPLRGLFSFTFLSLLLSLALSLALQTRYCVLNLRSKRGGDAPEGRLQPSAPCDRPTSREAFIDADTHSRALPALADSAWLPLETPLILRRSRSCFSKQNKLVRAAERVCIWVLNGREHGALRTARTKCPRKRR